MVLLTSIHLSDINLSSIVPTLKHYNSEVSAIAQQISVMAVRVQGPVLMVVVLYH